MPWHVAKSKSCPASKPWAVIKDADGSVVACHESEESAAAQVRALYASEAGSKAADVIEHKNIDVEFKAAGDDGTFIAFAAAFNNVDRVNDRIKPGAFSKSLKKWRASGKMLPVILSHNWDDIEAHIGYADPKQVKETAHGLEVKGHLDLDESETARRVHKLMQRRQLTAMSFGYTVPQGGEQLDDKGVNELEEIDLHEVGPTLVGANPKAELQAVKSALETETKETPEPDEEPKPEDEPKSDDELRRKSEQEERERIAALLPPDLPDEEAVEYKALLDSIRDLDRDERQELSAMLAIDELTDAPQDVKDRLTQRAEAILERTKSAEIEDDEGEEPQAKSEPQDPLRARSLEVVLDVVSAGLSNRRPTKAAPPPETTPEDELRRQSRDLELELLS